ncbi:MAG: RelA/SpoT family protein [Bacilli bacterium]
MNEENIKTYKDLLDITSSYLTKEEEEKLGKYYEAAVKIYDGMKRKTGEDYITHPIRVAISLSELKMDYITIGCALIHEAIILDKMSYDDILSSFDSESALIISCITKISLLKRTFTKDNNERYRKIIVGLADNPKALFIKIADRLDNLKTVYVHDLQHQKEIIAETNDVFIPIAHRLGIKKFKQELEDYCLRNSNKEEYKRVVELINSSRNELEYDLNLMKESIIEVLSEHNISFDITSRVKSVYGIYSKLQKGKKFNEIYDLLGIRILVKKTEECYLILGLLHSKYQSISKRFKDFIARPKGNMYQSLHTTVFGFNERMYEIQIRTYDMDQIAENGVASHWSYKEHTNGKIKTSVEERLESFKALIDVNNESNNMNFFKNLNNELNKEEMYVFTPKGDALELPIDSTPIDFAYRIHTEVGDTTVGAIVNGKIVKLDYKLQDGDIVNLLTEKGKKPNRNWLKSVKTNLAYNRIKSYFSRLEKEKIYKCGKELLEKEIRNLKYSVNDAFKEDNIKKVLKELNINNIEDLYFDVYTLKYTSKDVVDIIFGDNDKEEVKFRFTEQVIKNNNKNNVIVSGCSDLLTEFASCCKPIYGDEIIGYITKGEGVKIHRKTCKNVNLSSERIVDVSWNETNNNKYTTLLNVFYDLPGENILDIVTIATKNDITVLSFNSKTNKTGQFYELICSVKNIDNLNKFILELKSMKFINKIERSVDE